MNRIDGADLQSYLLLHRKWVTNLNFFAGEQLGQFDAGGQWFDFSREPGDPIYVVNFVQYFVGSLIKEWVRSRAALDVAAVSDSIEMRAGARPLAEFIRLNERRIWTPTKNEREGKQTIILGNSFRYTRFNPKLGLRQRVPRIEEQQLTLGGAAFYCGDCGCMGPQDEAEQPACGQCGSRNVAISQAPVVPAPRVTGFDYRQSGDADTRVVSPFEIKLDLHANDLEESSYLRRQQFILRQVLESAFPWAILEAETGAGDGADDLGLQYQRQIERSAGNVTGEVNGSPGTREDDGLIRFRQYWLEPERYCHFRWESDEVMADGEVVRAGTRALDLFPRGLCFSTVAGTILEASPEAKNDLWDQMKWELMPGNAFGHGIEHMVEQNMISNDFFSLMYEAAMHYTLGRTILNPTLIDRQDWKNKPGWVATMKQGVTRNDDPGRAATIISPQANFGALQSMMEQVKGDMRLTSGGAFNTASGVGEPEASTATATAILRDQALSMLLPKLTRKTEIEIATGRKWLRIIRDYDLYEAYFSRISQFSEFEIEQARQLDPEYDLIITPRPGSLMPQSEMEKLAALDRAGQMGGVPGGIFNRQVFPDHIRRLVCDYLNVPFVADKSQADERNTMIRLHRLLRFAEQMEQADAAREAMIGQASGQVDPAQMQALAAQPVVDPATLLAQAAEIAPVRWRYDDHPTCMETIEDWFRRDQGLNASPVAELLINDLYSRHLQGLQLKQQEQMMAQAGPQMMAAAAAPPASAGARESGRPAGRQPEQRPEGDASPGTRFVKPVRPDAIPAPVGR